MTFISVWTNEKNQRAVCFTFHFCLEDEPFMSSKVAFCTVDYVCMYVFVMFLCYVDPRKISDRSCGS